MHEFLPEKTIPADLEVDAFNPAYFGIGAQEAPMRDDLPANPTDTDDYEEDAEPDVTVYPEIKDAKCAYTIRSSSRRRKVKMQGHKREKVGRTAWAWAYLCMEVKADPPPFVVLNLPGLSAEGLEAHDLTLPTTGEVPSVREECTQSMEKISRFATKIMRRQFVAHCFTMFICRNYARLMRWDRAGVVISEPFDFIEQPHLLHKFFYLFACMTDVERGCDPTVVPATEAEIGRMRTFTNYDTPWHEAKFLSSVKEGPVVKILWPLPPREFLVGKPLFMSNSPTGSGTKGFVAYNVAEDRLVFLKDCWRPEAETYYPEGEVYFHLHSKKVKFIATPVGAGNVVDACGGIHTTRAHKFLQVGTPRWQHYRLILEEVAMPLEEYTNSYDLIDILDDAIRAHRDAWAADVLHRDVSAFNIMIYWYKDKNGKLKRKGLLLDWGLCKFAYDLKLPAVLKNRSGTWQFICAVLLVFPGKFSHEVWHDLESFVHVFHCLYDFHSTKNGISVGGGDKLLMLRQGKLPFYLLGGSFDPLLPRADPTKPGYGPTELVTSLSSLCKVHYKSLEGQSPKLATTSSSNPAPAAEPANVAVVSDEVRSGLGRRTRTTQDVKLEEPARPVLNDHTEILALLDNALYTGPNDWIYHPKEHDQFAQFKSSHLERRASRS
ncbi:hypothetical protein FOMPIDRAFT_93307 [Fomitopsis schrenkii]|uniref:Fungal-type protein kinase domain-containing protein n=1 Tax=Fomitopsis schrenkii TaxID=2126942 RepID=S8F362_FOMSC|nr:hypothetical protein FOMPIDRAFT_93307 [Fomitopsis schrenkii]